MLEIILVIFDMKILSKKYIRKWTVHSIELKLKAQDKFGVSNKKMNDKNLILTKSFIIIYF
jgi:hypothetical protein